MQLQKTFEEDWATTPPCTEKQGHWDLNPLNSSQSRVRLKATWALNEQEDFLVQTAK